MYCFRCEDLLDFASNPIGKIVKLNDGTIRMYCKKCAVIKKSYPGVKPYIKKEAEG